MKTQALAPGWTALAATLCCLGTLSIGCSRSGPTADTAPTDIRGEPINSPLSSSRAAAAQPRPDLQPRPAAGPKTEEFASVTFEKLASFEFVMPDETVTTNGIVSPSAPDQFPQAVKALDQTRVALHGFMLPLKVDSGLVTEMLLMRDQSMCCYGKVPKITEWVSVKMTGQGVKAVIDQPITLYGRLHVGEMRENGYLVGIYRMDGETMSVPE